MRQWNEPDLNAYLEAGVSGNFSVVQGGEYLDQDQLTMEKIMLGLRTAAGVSLDYLRDHCDTHALEQALASANLVTLEDGNIRIPEDRFFVSDNIILTLIA